MTNLNSELQLPLPQEQQQQPPEPAAQPQEQQQQPKPRSEAQREASRANGALSHGPITERGKANSCRNALRHGLRAKTLVLANESPEILETLCAEYEAEHQPETPTECDLVTEMAYAKWRQYRVWLSETATLNKELAETKPVVDNQYEDCDESIRTAVAVESSLDRGRVLDMYNRVETRCNRQYHRALSTLLALRKTRLKQPKNERTNLRSC